MQEVYAEASCSPTSSFLVAGCCSVGVEFLVVCFQGVCCCFALNLQGVGVSEFVGSGSCCFGGCFRLLCVSGCTAVSLC